MHLINYIRSYYIDITFLGRFLAGNYMFKVNNVCKMLKLNSKDTGVVLVSLLLTSNIFPILFYCFWC